MYAVVSVFTDVVKIVLCESKSGIMRMVVLAKKIKTAMA